MAQRNWNDMRELAGEARALTPGLAARAPAAAKDRPRTGICARMTTRRAAGRMCGTPTRKPL
jgi:hypothetical protein